MLILPSAYISKISSKHAFQRHTNQGCRKFKSLQVSFFVIRLIGPVSISHILGFLAYVIVLSQLNFSVSALGFTHVAFTPTLLLFSFASTLSISAP